MNVTLPTIKLGDLEGPFDLILELVHKKDLDLSEVSLKQVTRDFFVFMRRNRLDPEVQGSFLIVASTLLLIKARQLLPNVSPEEEEEIFRFSDRIAVYNLYRQQANNIRERWDKVKLFAPMTLFNTSYPSINKMAFPAKTTPSYVHQIFHHMIAKLPKIQHPKAYLATKGLSLQECFSLFMRRLRRMKDIVFQDVVRNRSRQDTATSFIAILEMARSHKVEIHQERLFEPIRISRRTV